MTDNWLTVDVPHPPSLHHSWHCVSLALCVAPSLPPLLPQQLVFSSHHHSMLDGHQLHSILVINIGNTAVHYKFTCQASDH